MSKCHLCVFLKSIERKAKLLSLELCAHRELNIPELITLAPAFCSVTWLDNKVLDIKEYPTILLSRKLIENDIKVLMHLPGRIYSQKEILDILTFAKDAGVKNILAVQGERSLGESKQDFPFAYNLVNFIKGHFGNYFCIGVTGYPAGHPRCPDLKEDIRHLKQKVESGADFIITQAVFDFATFHNFHKRCRNHEINVPILPGMFIINSYSSLMNMVKFCKLELSDQLKEFVNKNRDNDEALEEYGINSTVETMENLFNVDDITVNCIHIFTLNNLVLVNKVLSKLK